MIDHIVNNREELTYLYAAVILGLTFHYMSAKGWKGNIIKYSVGAFALACVVLSADYIRGLV